MLSLIRVRLQTHQSHKSYCVQYIQLLTVACDCHNTYFRKYEVLYLTSSDWTLCTFIQSTKSKNKKPLISSDCLKDSPNILAPAKFERKYSWLSPSRARRLVGRGQVLYRYFEICTKAVVVKS